MLIFIPSILHMNVLFPLRWFRARDLFGSQIPVTTEGFELRISCIRNSYLTLSHYGLYLMM